MVSDAPPTLAPTNNTGNGTSEDIPVEWCYEDAHCRVDGDTGATCNTAAHKCDCTSSFTNRVVSGNTYLGCYTPSGALPEVTYTIRFAFSRGTCSLIDDAMFNRLVAIVAKLLDTPVASLTTTRACGSFYMAVSGKLPVETVIAASETFASDFKAAVDADAAATDTALKSALNNGDAAGALTVDMVAQTHQHNCFVANSQAKSPVLLNGKCLALECADGAAKVYDAALQHSVCVAATSSSSSSGLAIYLCVIIACAAFLCALLLCLLIYCLCIKKAAKEEGEGAQGEKADENDRELDGAGAGAGAEDAAPENEDQTTRDPPSGQPPMQTFPPRSPRLRDNSPYGYESRASCFQDGTGYGGYPNPTQYPHNLHDIHAPSLMHYVKTQSRAGASYAAPSHPGASLASQPQYGRSTGSVGTRENPSPFPGALDSQPESRALQECDV